MGRHAALLLCLAVAGCGRAPAPDVPALTPSPESAAAPKPAATVADIAPSTAPALSGERCWTSTPPPGPGPSFLPDGPVGVLARFYDAHAPHAGAGVPDGEPLAAVAPLLTRGLRAALDRARLQRDAARAQDPGAKPPFVEGALFASLFEGYTRFQPQAIETEGDIARVRTCFAFEDAGGRTEWLDTVVLRREDGAWRIDDVVYGGQWDFANTGTLRGGLPKAE